MNTAHQHAEINALYKTLEIEQAKAAKWEARAKVLLKVVERYSEEEKQCNGVFEGEEGVGPDFTKGIATLALAAYKKLKDE